MIDPHRTLGLAPGATPGEIKRAYRRLAKQYHPDSAGPTALPRFLAIQAAYETLLDVEPAPTQGPTNGRSNGAKPGARSRSSWQADAERARATREAYRARYRSTSRDAGSRASGAPSSGHPGGPRSGAERPRGDAGRPRGGRRVPKATIGSTSYDDAEGFAPAWDGATWYGPGSGTYWTLNPKEYADPRKHGPEYQARSRRGSAGDGRPVETNGESRREPANEPRREPANGPHGDPASDTRPGAAANRSDPAGAWSDPTAPRPDRAAPGAADGVATGPASGSGYGAHRRGSHQPPGAFASWAAEPREAPRPIDGSSIRVRGPARSAPGRLAMAMLGWVPIALLLSRMPASVTACQGTTTCVDPLSGGMWIANLAVILLLVAIPRLGWIAAVASAAFLIGGLLATPVLLVMGGAQTPEGAGVVLQVVLRFAWLGGVAVALSGRLEVASQAAGGT